MCIYHRISLGHREHTHSYKVLVEGVGQRSYFSDMGRILGRAAGDDAVPQAGSGGRRVPASRPGQAQEGVFTGAQGRAACQKPWLPRRSTASLQWGGRRRDEVLTRFTSVLISSTPSRGSQSPGKPTEALSAGQPSGAQSKTEKGQKWVWREDMEVNWRMVSRAGYLHWHIGSAVDP